jgi:hypothetical protein
LDKIAFDTLGWAKLPFDAPIANWVQCAYANAIAAANDPKHHPQWLRAQGTWFVGVDVLGNDPQGAVAGSETLTGPLLEAAQYAMGQDQFDWGHGQVSVCYAGYPKQEAESDAAFRYRQIRASAHLDGLKPVGDLRRRMMQEFHGFILGIPLNETPPNAAPFVIWEGSHMILRDMLRQAYQGVPTDAWETIDITDIYKKTRAHIFETCKRVEIHANLGEAYIAHRFALHGMDAWDESLDGPGEGRIIAYFRPYWQNDMQQWLKG